MEIDNDKLDDVVLALLYHNRFKSHPKDDWYQAWKSLDWDTMDRLHEKGFISNPIGKSKSISFSDEGFAKSEQLFRDLFTKDSQSDS